MPSSTEPSDALADHGPARNPNPADPRAAQDRLFAALSAMYAREAPLYAASLEVNRLCNRAVGDLLAKIHRGFRLSDDDLGRGGAERHGAIRIGREDEYRWIARYFALFGMEPHNFYDMTDVGAKSQPVIATAFRSSAAPQHRVFASLLVTSSFDGRTRERLDALLAARDVFSERAKETVARAEDQGGLDEADALALVEEGVNRIFKWTGRARDRALYTELVDGGFKIAADIACFETHHLNHLTPNTFCMDLFTASMKFALGELTAGSYLDRAKDALVSLAERADRDWMVLHFTHFAPETIDAFEREALDPDDARAIVEPLAAALGERSAGLPAAGAPGEPERIFKDHTEGPPAGVPVLLRQDAYRARPEPITFVDEDVPAPATHTARFGEIEQRFYATTAKGRELYDECLARQDGPADSDCFRRFPGHLSALYAGGLVFVRPRATAAGRDAAARGEIKATDLDALAAAGHVRLDGLRYEDFLPVSAAGIFASNLEQYGTASTSDTKPAYERADLERLMGRPIIDAMAVCRALQSAATLRAYRDLGLLDLLPEDERRALEADVEAEPAGAVAVITGG